MITKELVRDILTAESKATSGPWTTESGMDLYPLTGKADTRGIGLGSSYDEQSNNARFIAMVDPKTIRALCESWLEQREKIEKLEHQLKLSKDLRFIL